MLSEFKEYLLIIGKSENTVLNYCDKVKLYIKWCLDSFGSEPQQIYRANVLDYIAYMKTIKRYNPKSVNNHLSSLRSYNEFLISTGRQTELTIVKNDFMKIQVQYANPCTVEQKDVEAFRQRLLESGNKRDLSDRLIIAARNQQRSAGKTPAQKNPPNPNSESGGMMNPPLQNLVFLLAGLFT